MAGEIPQAIRVWETQQIVTLPPAAPARPVQD